MSRGGNQDAVRTGPPLVSVDPRAPAALGAARAGWRVHLGRDADPDELRRRLICGSLAEAFHLTAAESPLALALELDGHPLTHGQLDQLAARLAGWLSNAGLAAGAPVLLCATSSLRLVGAYLGALRLGATVVLANPGLTEAELAQLLRSCRPRLVLAAGAPAATLQRLARGQREVGTVADLTRLVGDDGQPLGELADAASLAPVAVAGGHVALLAYTSGTTGRPKCAPLTHANLLSSIRSAMLAWDWSREDVLVHALPLFHQHGLGGLHATLLAGSRAVIGSRFDPATLAGSISRAGATVLFGVPSMYERLLGWEGLPVADLSSLRLIISGSAPLSPALAGRLEARLGQLPLERYGATESGLDVSNPLNAPRRPGTVGLPLPGVELAVTDSSGHPVPPGDVGEVTIRGPQVFAGYRDDPQATAEAFFAGDWFRTGDLGRLDPHDGYLEITGRLKEVILTGGMNVYPREVELVLEAADAVEHVAVVGVASERWGEEVAAVVVPRAGAGLDAAELINFARTRLAAYKCPKRVLMMAELPLTAIGKLDRTALRKLVEADETRQARSSDDQG